MNYFEMEPERYYSWPSSYDKTRREDRLSQMVTSGNYMWSLKTDGNYSRLSYKMVKQNSKLVALVRKPAPMVKYKIRFSSLRIL